MHTLQELHVDAHVELSIMSVQGLLRELNPGPLGPKPRIMPLDQAAKHQLFPRNASQTLATCRELVYIVLHRSFHAFLSLSSRFYVSG